MHCTNCENMPEGFFCMACGKTGKERAIERGKPSDFTYQYYSCTVIVTATEPVPTYRHGPRKGDPKGVGWNKKILETPTFLMDYNIQGIRNEKHCESILRATYNPLVDTLTAAGYTEIRVSISAVGVTFGTAVVTG